MREPIEFSSDGVTLRGYHHRSAGSGPSPVVVMSHGWGATIAMGLGPHAAALTVAGYDVVLYDQPCFGLSDGEPRQRIGPWARTRASRAAIDLAVGLDGVDPDRVAVWGDSGDAERVFLDAATDPRVAAIISYNPTFGAEVPDAPPSRETFDAIQDVLTLDRLPSELAMERGPEPIVSPDPEARCMSPSPQAFRWFLEYGGRHGSGWTNTWSFALPDVGVMPEAYDCLPHVEAAALVVAGRDDEIPVCVPEVQRAALALTSGPQVWRQIGGGHFGALYHPSPLFDDLLEVELEFLGEHLR
jgi:pimeloyl-ACP methyl ester carboxylesterase